MNQTILSCCNLTKKYNGKVALNNINLELPKGSIIGLLGPNGSGKTTFIKLVAGLLTSNSGSIKICDKKIGIETKKIVSYLPDKDYLNNWMNVNQLINQFCDFYDDFNKEKAFDMLNSLSINSLTKLKTMSKGTKEKVQLILTMSREAKLYLLDEPIGGVDPAARDYILNTIISNYQEESTVLISTHLISDVEQILNHFIFLKDGNIIKQGEIEQIREQSGKSIDALFREEFKC